jgi:hypothetical protein
MSNHELTVNPEIQNKIFTIRGLQIMLDRDLALFYEVKSIRLREQVKRNFKRFPPDFMFQLTESETDFMVSQNAIPSKQHLGGSLPYAFTEQGVAAISSVLTSDRAIEVSIQIVRAFVGMRRFIANNAQIFQRLGALETKQFETDKKMDQMLNAIESKAIKPKQGIFFDGQIFDAYGFVADIVRTAKKSILLIDNYVDDTVLTLFAKRKKEVSLTILTQSISKTLELDLKKFNAQYQHCEIKVFRNSHDRFMILDDSVVYHFGASLKDLGKKWFAFSKMDKSALDILSKLEGIL